MYRAIHQREDPAFILFVDCFWAFLKRFVAVYCRSEQLANLKTYWQSIYGNRSAAEFEERNSEYYLVLHVVFILYHLHLHFCKRWRKYQLVDSSYTSEHISASTERMETDGRSQGGNSDDSEVGSRGKGMFKILSTFLWQFNQKPSQSYSNYVCSIKLSECTCETNWQDTVELAVHTILYMRQIYAFEFFEKRTAYGLPVYQCRNETICRYIWTAIDALGEDILVVSNSPYLRGTSNPRNFTERPALVYCHHISQRHTSRTVHFRLHQCISFNIRDPACFHGSKPDSLSYPQTIRAWFVLASITRIRCALD